MVAGLVNKVSLHKNEKEIFTTVQVQFGKDICYTIDYDIAGNYFDYINIGKEISVEHDNYGYFSGLTFFGQFLPKNN